MHRGFNQLLRVAVHRKLVHMDDQRDSVAAREFLRPINDEFFCIIIEVPLVERRPIDGQTLRFDGERCASAF